MAGRPGRSGGARANTGGARPGAGRPRNPPVLLDVGQHDEPKAFLIAVMNCGDADLKLRLDAAKKLMAYMHVRKREVGKRDEQADAAKKAGAGKFKPSRPPLAVVR